MTNEEFVIKLYLHLLGRPPEAGAVENWTNFLASGRTRSDVLEEFMSSAEFKARKGPEIRMRYPFPELPGLASALPVRICDVGAMCVTGEAHVYQPLLDAGACEIVGFEPQIAEMEKRQRSEPACRLFPYAIGDGSTVTFYEVNKPWGSSCYKPDWEFMHQFFQLGVDAKVVAEIPIETRRLDDIEEVRGTDFLKLDIQGAEYDALRGAGELLDTSVLVIHVEVEFAPAGFKQPLFADVDALVRDHGFELIDFSHLQRYSYQSPVAKLCRGTRLIWGDAVYFRSKPRLQPLGREAMLRAAYIAHVNYQWYDLATHLLEGCGLRAQYESAMSQKES